MGNPEPRGALLAERGISLPSFHLLKKKKKVCSCNCPAEISHIIIYSVCITMILFPFYFSSGQLLIIMYYYYYYYVLLLLCIIIITVQGCRVGKAGCTLFQIKRAQPHTLKLHIETRCPNTAGVFIYFSVLFFIQILSAFQRQESTRRHATGPHCSLLGLIKTVFVVLEKNRKENRKKRLFTLLKGQ